MTNTEKYELKRQNFLINANKSFNFLVEEFGYKKIEQEEYRQPNGTVIQDEIIYQNLEADRSIIVLNVYHPVDYGFEIDFYKPSESLQHSEREMVFYVLKEDQDLEQSYIESIAKKLKAQFSEQIKGHLWF